MLFCAILVENFDNQSFIKSKLDNIDNPENKSEKSWLHVKIEEIIQSLMEKLKKRKFQKSDIIEGQV
jgi:hypothetical protein